jgi:hypothetical protein
MKRLQPGLDSVKQNLPQREASLPDQGRRIAAWMRVSLGIEYRNIVPFPDVKPLS